MSHKGDMIIIRYHSEKEFPMKYGVTVFSSQARKKSFLPVFMFYRVFWKIIRIYVDTGCEFQLEASVKTSKHWEICVNFEFPCFYWEFNFSFSCKRTAPFCLWLNLFGMDLHLYWGDGRHEEYDGHLDKYYDYDALVAEHPDYDYKQIDAIQTKMRLLTQSPYIRLVIILFDILPIVLNTIPYMAY